MAELTPLTEADLAGLLAFAENEVRFCTARADKDFFASFPRLIAELRALRAAVRHVLPHHITPEAENGEYLAQTHYTAKASDLRRLRDLLPPPPVVALDGSGERG